MIPAQQAQLQNEPGADLSWMPPSDNPVFIAGLRTAIAQAYADPAPPTVTQFPVSFPDTVRAAARAADFPALANLDPKPERTSPLAVAVYPDTVRGAARVVEFLAASEIQPQPERTSPLAATVYPDWIDRRVFPPAQQLAVSEIPPKPERTSPIAITLYPDWIDRRVFVPAQQLAASEIPPQPERTSPLASVYYQDRFPAPVIAERQAYGDPATPPPPPPTFFGATYPDEPLAAGRVVEFQFTTEISPQPERTSPLASVDYPNWIDRRVFPPAQQLAVSEIPPKPERTSPLAVTVYPDDVKAAQRVTEFPAYAANIAPERTSPLAAVYYPDRFPPPAIAEFQAITEISPAPERTSSIAVAVFPDWIDRRVFPPAQQLAVSEISPEPERTAPFAEAIFPAEVTRPAAQTPFEFAPVSLAALVPPLVEGRFPDTVRGAFLPIEAGGTSEPILPPAPTPPTPSVPPVTGGDPWSDRQPQDEWAYYDWRTCQWIFTPDPWEALRGGVRVTVPRAVACISMPRAELTILSPRAEAKVTTPSVAADVSLPAVHATIHKDEE